MKQIWVNKLRNLLVNETGAVALVFALAIPVIMAGAGVAVDLAQAYNVKNRLGNALDKAALAAGSTDGTTTEIQDRVQKFFNANYPSNKLGATYDLTVYQGNGSVSVSARAHVKTTFMSLVGQDYVDVYAESAVKRELAGVEAVLVLDVTGSMAGNNITALRTAATNFLNTMFTRIVDPAYIKIGIVPYSDTVNVGPYGLGVDLTGKYYGTPFVDKPATDNYISPASNIKYGTGTTDWRGCITERASPKDTNDDSSPNWGMYRYPKICSKMKNGVCQSYSNNNPNTACPSSVIIPLTNNKATLQSAVTALTPGGNTYGNVGMVWGYHVLTPTPPFTEGVSLTDPYWTRVVIMMTDGDNTVNPTYSAYGANSTLTPTDENNKYAAVCTNMKNDGIIIYTITFQSAINDNTRSYYRNCASDPGKYFNAPTNTSLIEAFNTIANQLSQLHIVN